jgi:hypothetical protein
MQQFGVAHDAGRAKGQDSWLMEMLVHSAEEGNRLNGGSAESNRARRLSDLKEVPVILAVTQTLLR